MQPKYWDRWLDASIVGGFTRLGYQLRRPHFAPLPESLAGRHIAITGANSGLGAAATQMLAARGARISLLCRSTDAAQALVRELAAQHPQAQLEVVACDLADLASIDAAAAALADAPPLDALINNAGVLNRQRELDDQGREQSFAINVLGTFALTWALSPRLREDGRIVTVSSGGMYGAALNLRDPEFRQRRWDGVRAYAEHKRAQLVLTRRWAELWPRRKVNAMHPGWAATPGVARSLPGFSRVMGPLLRPPEEGIDTAVWLAVAPEVERSGAFWCDRRVRPTVRIARTRPRPGDAARLWRMCVEATGRGAEGQPAA